MVCSTCDQDDRFRAAETLVDKLTGRLIGLARATEGNDHLISTATSDLVMEGLSASLINDSLQNERLTDLINRVENEKYRMVPDCRTCAAPCGRTDDYDMNRLRSATENVRNLKMQILTGSRNIASFAHRAALLGCRDERIHGFLYMALFSIGMDDWGEEELIPIVQEINDILPRSMALLDKVSAESALHSESAEVNR